MTGPDGTFSLKGLPPGTYTIEAWHEKLGTQTQMVTIGAKETKDVAFTFKSARQMLPLFAAFVAASTAVLIFAGGLVTSTGSGLSVPDWPNTYGWFMFAFPMSKMVGGIFYEHAHRLIASTVGFLIVVLAVWLGRAEPRPWVRRLGYLALGAVITQGILGGITVLWYLPDAISIAHASLAQIVFCLTVTIALATSTGWRRAYAKQKGKGVGEGGRDSGRPHAAAHRDRDDCRDLRADSDWRDDETYGSGAGDPGLPALVRSCHSAVLGLEDRHSFRPSRRRGHCDRAHRRNDRPRVLSPCPPG